MDPGAAGLAVLPIRRFQNGAWRDMNDDVAVETRVRLFWPGREEKVLWAFPENLDDLALGHAALDICAAGESPVIREVSGQDYYLDPAPEQAPANVPDFSLSAPEVMAAMAAFIGAPGRFEATGCFHRAALFDPRAKAFIRQAEDIGRHNCIDRLTGFALARGLPLSGLALFVSARVTASLAAKIARAGVRLAVSRSAVTTAGVQIAARAGLSLAGFARENRFSVFTDDAGRIT